MRKFRVYNFSGGEYNYCPNENIYTPSYPEFMIVEVEDDSLLCDKLIVEIKETILETIEVEWDTPDCPEYELVDIDFECEEIVVIS